MDEEEAQRVRADAELDQIMASARAAQRRVARSLGIVRAALWFCGTVCAGLLVWVGYSLVADEMGRPERERRVRACAVAMEHREPLRGPVAACEALSPAERQEAAHEFGRMRGLW